METLPKRAWEKKNSVIPDSSEKNVQKLIELFSKTFLIETKDSYHATENTQILTKTLPLEIKEKLELNETYKVYGSVGKSNWGEIPWLAVLDKAVSTSTEDGYYLAILFDKDSKHIYLSLAVGWVQFRQEYGTKEGRLKIRSVCDHYAKLLTARPQGFRSGVINLHADRALGHGYEKGSIISKKYLITELSEKILLDDMRELLESYKELKTIVGDSILNLEIDSTLYDETLKTFRKKIAAESLSVDTAKSIEELIEMANEEPPEIRTKFKKEIVRNRKFANYVKMRVHFICEICNRKPFIQVNGKPYAEADHITRLGGSTRGLDSPDNMRCVCAQCHSVLTHGFEEEIKNLLVPNERDN